jgi:hypothetical protein
MSAKAMNGLWEQLTFPEEMSTTLAESSDFHKLLLEIRSSARSSEAFSRGAKRAILSLEPAVRDRILSHRSKWSFLGYHGYGWAYCEPRDPEATYPVENNDLTACEEEWWNDGDPLPSGG